MKFKKYFKNYNKSIYELLNHVDTSLIDDSVELILECKKNNGKVYIVGNGGSSSIASHVSVDFAKVANIKSDTFNNSNLITCFANDFGHDNWIKESIKALCANNPISSVFVANEIVGLIFPTIAKVQTVIFITLKIFSNVISFIFVIFLSFPAFKIIVLNKLTLTPGSISFVIFAPYSLDIIS